jgi:hypothetical protein
MAHPVVHAEIRSKDPEPPPYRRAGGGFCGPYSTAPRGGASGISEYTYHCQPPTLMPGTGASASSPGPRRAIVPGN